MKLDHIGIAVTSLADSVALYSSILGKKPFKEETLEAQKVKVAFFDTGDTSKIELLEGIGEDSPISKFIAKRGQGIHHTAFLVDNILEEIDRLISEGLEPLQETPRLGADNKLVFFFHPKSTHGVLLELCQKAK